MEEKRCLGCMKLKTSSPVCEHCGYDERTHNDPHRLPAGTVLKEQYLVGRVLGQGGFGITYLGWDLYLDIPVAIKEYYPAGVVMRDTTVTMDVVSCSGDDGVRFRNSKEKFMREAKMLARFSQVPEIVQVKNFFLANNTAYIVMEYVQGITLKQYVKDRGGRLSVEETFRILRPVIEALCKVHKAQLVHRDISPDNIMMLPGGGAKLLDFGAVRDVGAAVAGKELTKSTEAILKQGYAPIEQYQKRGGLGPWTDVYALCATIYYCLTGEVPPDAPERLLGYEDLELHKRVPELTEDQVKALEHGMELRAELRTPSMDELFRELFCAQPDPEPVPVPEPKPEPRTQTKTQTKTAPQPEKKPAPKTQTETAKAPQKPKKKKGPRLLLIGVLAAAAVVLAASLFGGEQGTGELLPETEVSGECGKYAAWSLDLETGELVIDGANGMPSYRPDWESEDSGDLPPWYDYRDQITSVTITGSITGISEYAFAGLENLKTANIGGAVEVIRAGAFQNSGLEAVSFTSMTGSTGDMENLIGEAKQESQPSLMTIEANAFCGTALKQVNLPESVIDIGANAFGRCASLTKVTLGRNACPSYDTWKGCVFTDENGDVPENLTLYCYDCSPAADYAGIWGIKTVLSEGSWDTEGACGGGNLTYHINFEAGFIKVDGSGAMMDYNGPWMYQEGNTPVSSRTLAPWAEYRESLRVLSIGDQVTKIGENAFANCNIRDVYFGSSLKTIEQYAFAQTLLDELVPSDSVNNIRPNAFGSCQELRYVAISNCPDGVFRLLDATFSGCTNMESLYLGSNVAFLDGTNYNIFTEPGQTEVPQNLCVYSLDDSPGKAMAEENGFAFQIGMPDMVADYSGQCGDRAYWFLSGDTLVIYGLGDTWHYNLSQEDIAGWAKKDYEAGRAFLGQPGYYTYCTQIKHAIVLPGLNNLNTGLFYNLYSLKTVDLQGGNSIKANFHNCQNLREVVFWENIGSIDANMFSQCYLLESVTVQGDAKIATPMFYDCRELKDVYFEGRWIQITDNGRQDLITSAGIYDVDGTEKEDYNENLTFHVYSNSNAELYAKTYGINYEIIE